MCQLKGVTLIHKGKQNLNKAPNIPPINTVIYCITYSPLYIILCVFDYEKMPNVVIEAKIWNKITTNMR